MKNILGVMAGLIIGLVLQVVALFGFFIYHPWGVVDFVFSNEILINSIFPAASSIIIGPFLVYRITKKKKYALITSLLLIISPILLAFSISVGF
jgi:hypothetical protein